MRVSNRSRSCILRQFELKVLCAGLPRQYYQNSGKYVCSKPLYIYHVVASIFGLSSFKQNLLIILLLHMILLRFVVVFLMVIMPLSICLVIVLSWFVYISSTVLLVEWRFSLVRTSWRLARIIFYCGDNVSSLFPHIYVVLRHISLHEIVSWKPAQDMIQKKLQFPRHNH